MSDFWVFKTDGQNRYFLLNTQRYRVYWFQLEETHELPGLLV